MSLLALFTVLSILGSCTAVDWTKLHLKYNLLLDGYYPIALTLKSLTERKESLTVDDTNWKPMTYDEDLKVQFYSRGEDPRVSIGFLPNGNIAGVRLSYVIKDLSIKAKKNGLAFPYTYADKPMYTKANYWNTDVYYTTVLFASPETIAMGGPKNKNGIFAENIFVKINGKYTQMPKKESDAPSQGFTKQGCVPGMGRHYFFGTTSSSECNDLQQVFLLYKSGELIGIGLSPFGSFTSGTRTWFEDPISKFLEIIVPNRPICLTKWNDDYGMISIHLFFNESPRMTTC